VRWIVERDGGVFRIRQAATVQNPSLLAVIAAKGEPPLLRLGLPAGRGDLETPFGTLPAGAAIEEDGISLRGPIFPGERTYRFAYDMKQPEARLRVDLALPDAAGEVEMLVRDFGAASEAAPLHPARPVRDADQFYQRYVGFDLPAGTRISLGVTPLPPVAPLPLPLIVLLVGLVAGALGYFVVRPVAAETRSALAHEPAEAGAEAEKRALVVGLHDLEHDFETGNLSLEDRDALREEMRREALAALSRARAQTRPGGAAPREGEAAADASARCDCDYPTRPGDRFCAGCGKPL
jgi:hypothetical protein